MRITVGRLLIAWLLIGGCSKKSVANKDKELPVIIITTPVNNQVFTPGQVLTISGTVTDNSSLAEVHIHVNNAVSGIEYLDTHFSPASNSATFSNQSLTTVAGTSYKIQILAVDKSANEAISTIQVSCN